MTPDYLFSETKRHAATHKHFGNDHLTCRRHVFTCLRTTRLMVADKSGAKGLVTVLEWNHIGLVLGQSIAGLAQGVLNSWLLGFTQTISKGNSATCCQHLVGREKGRISVISGLKKSNNAVWLLNKSSICFNLQSFFRTLIHFYLFYTLNLANITPVTDSCARIHTECCSFSLKPSSIMRIMSSFSFFSGSDT